MSKLFGFYSQKVWATTRQATRFHLPDGTETVVTHAQASPAVNFPHFEDLIAVGELADLIGQAREIDVLAVWPA
jgi:hypothetical protein